MPTLSKTGLYTPLGTQVGTCSAAGTTTTFLTTNADAADMNIGDVVKIYTTTNGFHQLRSFAVTITNKQADTPGAGTTTFTVSPTLGTSTASGDLVYSPEVVDVETWVSNNMSKTDYLLGAYPCTSSTRPSNFQVSLFPDMLIYERDTQNILRYDAPSGSWFIVCNPRRARGRMGYASSNAAGATISAGNISASYLSVTFTARKNQWYKVFASYNIEYVSGTFAEAFVEFHRGIGGTVSSSDFFISRVGADVNAGSLNGSVNNRAMGVYKHVAADQQVTIGMFLSRDGMSDSDTIRFSPNQFNTLMVEDIGQ